MKFDVYLIMNEDGAVETQFTSELQARDYLSYKKGLNVQRIEVKVPTEILEKIKFLDAKSKESLFASPVSQEIIPIDIVFYNHLTHALELNNGNKDATARALKMSPTNFRHHLKKLENIKKEDW